MRYTQRIVIALVVTGLALSVPGAATAQPPKSAAPAPPAEPANLSSWLRAAIAAAIEQRKISENGNGIANQKESPSTDQTSTSLVDTSSATDFVSLALNVSGLRRGDDNKPTSGSVTSSLYSLVAAAKGTPITDPTFYKSGTALRRLTLTLGTEESKTAQHFTDKPSTNLGAKFLIVNHRDVYSGRAQTEFAKMESALGRFIDEKGPIRGEIECLIFRGVDPKANAALPCIDDPAFLSFLTTIPFSPQNWSGTLAKLKANAAAMERIAATVGRLAALHEGLGEAINTAVEKVQRGRQLAVAYFTKQREDDGTDEHRAELIFDYGLSERLNWTMNAGFDFRDRKQNDDTRSGRFATEFQAKLGGSDRHLWSARPVMLSGSGEATKASGSDALIRAQIKLSLPVMSGVDIPIAYSYANRDDEGVVSGSQLKFSLALDPVRLRERLR